MSKSLCHDCIHNCTDHRNNICANHKGIWCNAEYGRVINKKVKGCKNYIRKENIMNPGCKPKLSKKQLVKDTMTVLTDFCIVHGENEDRIEKEVTDIVYGDYPETQMKIKLDNYTHDLIYKALNGGM